MSARESSGEGEKLVMRLAVKSSMGSHARWGAVAAPSFVGLVLVVAMASAADVTPPFRPGGDGLRNDGGSTRTSSVVTATSLDDHSVSVNWWGAIDDVGVARHCVIRTEAPENPPRRPVRVEVGCVSRGNVFVDESVESGHLYNYSVVAEDGAGNRSLPAISSAGNGSARVLPSGYRRSLEVSIPWESRPGEPIRCRRRITCEPACVIESESFLATTDLDIPVSTDPRLTIETQGGLEGVSITSDERELLLLPGSATGAHFGYLRIAFAPSNGWNPVPSDGTQQALVSRWAMTHVTWAVGQGQFPGWLPTLEVGQPATLDLRLPTSTSTRSGIVQGSMLPSDLHLLPNGTLVGTPTVPSFTRFAVRHEWESGNQSGEHYILCVGVPSPCGPLAPVRELKVSKDRVAPTIHLQWRSPDEPDGYST